MFNQHLLEENTYGIIFCDEITGISNDIEIIYPKLTKDSTNIIEKSFYVDSKKNNFIQIADICALYINKYFCITSGGIIYNDIKAKHCINMYNKIITLSKESSKDMKLKVLEDILRTLS